jgi:hypothetical protein
MQPTTVTEQEVSYFIELGLCLIHCSCAQIIFLAGFAGQGVLNKDPIVWLDGARPPLVSLLNGRESAVNTMLDGRTYPG